MKDKDKRNRNRKRKERRQINKEKPQETMTDRRCNQGEGHNKS